MKKLHVFLMLTIVTILASCGDGSGTKLLFTNYHKDVNENTPEGVPANLIINFAIPKGDGEALVIDIEKHILAHASIVEALGEPEGETLEAIADDYAERFKSGMAEGYLEAPCMYQLEIVCQYQSPQVVVLHVTDGVYGNGGPQEYLRLLNLADSALVDCGEITSLTNASISKLALQYADDNTKEYLRENRPEDFWIAPDSAGCKIKLQTGTHFFSDFVVPVEEIMPYLTEKGKTLFGIATETTATEETPQESKSSFDDRYPVQYILDAYEAALQKQLPPALIAEELAPVVEEAKTAEILVEGNPFGISCSKAVVYDYNIQSYGINILLQFIPEEGTDFNLVKNRGPYGKTVYCLIFGKDDMVMRQTVTWATSTVLGVTLNIGYDRINKWKKFNSIRLTEIKHEFK